MPQIQDSKFSTSQSLASGTASGVISENCLHLHGLAKLGVGLPVYLEVHVETALEGAGDTCDIDLVSTSSDDISTFASLNVIKQALIVMPAETVAGTRFIVPLPIADITSGDTDMALRFYARGDGALTAGVVSAGLTLEPGFEKFMPRGDTHVG